MKITKLNTDPVSVWGIEITPHQLGLSTYKHRIVFDLGHNSIAIEWGKRNGN